MFTKSRRCDHEGEPEKCDPGTRRIKRDEYEIEPKEKKIDQHLVSHRAALTYLRPD